MPAVVRVPLGPPSLEGLANLRGRVLPVVSLRDQLLCCRNPARRGHPGDRGRRRCSAGLRRRPGVQCASAWSADAVEAADSVRSTVGSDVLVGVIKSSDGQMTTVLDVDQLVGAQFARLAGCARRRRDKTAVQAERGGRHRRRTRWNWSASRSTARSTRCRSIRCRRSCRPRTQSTGSRIRGPGARRHRSSRPAVAGGQHARRYSGCRSPSWSRRTGLSWCPRSMAGSSAW